MASAELSAPEEAAGIDKAELASRHAAADRKVELHETWKAIGRAVVTNAQKQFDASRRCDGGPFEQIEVFPVKVDFKAELFKASVEQLLPRIADKHRGEPTSAAASSDKRQRIEEDDDDESETDDPDFRPRGVLMRRGSRGGRRHSKGEEIAAEEEAFSLQQTPRKLPPPTEPRLFRLQAQTEAQADDESGPQPHEPGFYAFMASRTTSAAAPREEGEEEGQKKAEAEDDKEGDEAEAMMDAAQVRLALWGTMSEGDKQKYAEEEAKVMQVYREAVQRYEAACAAPATKYVVKVLQPKVAKELLRVPGQWQAYRALTVAGWQGKSAELVDAKLKYDVKTEQLTVSCTAALADAV